MVENKRQRGWKLEIGLYPGVLLGIRSYKEKTYTTHVLYIPLVDLALIIEN